MKSKVKPHAAKNVAAIDASIAADLSGGAGPLAPTIGPVVTIPVAPTSPPLTAFAQPLHAPAVPSVAPVVNSLGSPPPSTPATPVATGATPTMPSPRAAIHQQISHPLFSLDDAAPVAVAEEPAPDSPELAQLRADLATAKARNSEYEAALAAQPIKYEGLEHLEESVAQELHTKVVAPTVEAALKKQAAEFDKKFARYEADVATRALTETQRSQNTKQRQIADLNTAIFEAHPDFTEVSSTDWYLRAVAAVVPLTTQTFGDAIKQAYKSGNAEHVNKLVSHMKSNYAAATPVAMVLGGGGGGPDLSPVVQAAAAPAITRAEMDAARTQFQQGRLGRKEYSEKVSQYQAQT